MLWGVTPTTKQSRGKMETADIEKKWTISFKKLIYAVLITILFLALGIICFGEEIEIATCDLEKGLPQTLNLSPEQCKKIRQMSDRFWKDSQVMRARIMEKRLELKKALEHPNADPYNINKIERELNRLEHEFARMAQQTQARQRRVLTPEQINKMKDMSYEYGFHGYNIRVYKGP